MLESETYLEDSIFESGSGLQYHAIFICMRCALCDVNCLFVAGNLGNVGFAAGRLRDHRSRKRNHSGTCCDERDYCNACQQLQDYYDDDD